jgi:hypothetical protein
MHKFCKGKSWSKYNFFSKIKDYLRNNDSKYEQISFFKPHPRRYADAAVATVEFGQLDDLFHYLLRGGYFLS